MLGFIHEEFLLTPLRLLLGSALYPFVIHMRVFDMRQRLSSLLVGSFSGDAKST